MFKILSLYSEILQCLQICYLPFHLFTTVERSCVCFPDKGNFFSSTIKISQQMICYLSWFFLLCWVFLFQFVSNFFWGGWIIGSLTVAWEFKPFQHNGVFVVVPLWWIWFWPSICFWGISVHSKILKFKWCSSVLNHL